MGKIDIVQPEFTVFLDGDVKVGLSSRHVDVVPGAITTTETKETLVSLASLWCSSLLSVLQSCTHARWKVFSLWLEKCVFMGLKCLTDGISLANMLTH